MRFPSKSSTEAAPDYLSEIANIPAGIGIRKKYEILGRIFYAAVDYRLKGVSIKFAGMLPKIQYLIREYKIRENSNDYSLSTAINATRIRLRHTETSNEEALQASYPHDLKAVSKFISQIYGLAGMPEVLTTQFPKENTPVHSQRLKDGKDHSITSLRGIIESWDDTFIEITRADTGTRIRVDYASENPYRIGNQAYIRQVLIKGEQLNLIKPRINNEGVLIPELIIFNPDYLINVTAVAGCFEEYGCSAYLNLVARIKPTVSSPAILLGNLAGQMLDESAFGKKTSYSESLTEFFHNHPLSIACCENFPPDFHANAMKQKKIIEETLNSHNIHQKNTETLSNDDLITEPSFFCETLGLQGRMDFIHLNQDTIIEQKSGKAAFQSAPGSMRQQKKHYVQLLLYRAVFHYAYSEKRYEDIASYLFYSAYDNGLLELGSAPELLAEAIRIRNQIAWGELHYAQEGMNALETVAPQKIFPHAAGNRLWRDYQCPQMEKLLAPIHEASELERKYYFRFLRFISSEHVLSKIGNRTKENSGFAALWTSTTSEKRQAGNLYDNLSIPHYDDTAVINEVTLHASDCINTDIVNFRTGDIVVLYPYRMGEEPDASRTIVLRATITCMKPDGITLRLRNQQHARVFGYYEHDNIRWAIEHDFMESSYSALYRGMHSFLSADKKRRELILGIRKPDIDKSVTLNGDYSHSSDDEFNRLVLGAMQTNDIYLVIGPPGTGKTSFGMLNVLKEQLTHAGTSILLMAYTNRAVDEICGKLLDEGIDFLRLGSDFNCSPEYHHNLLDIRAKECTKVDDLRHMIISTRVICGTTTALNSHPEIFSLKKFRLAIIDEASQILEPFIIGLLSAKHNDDNAIDKFVLIGDEKQLSAVVQQEAEESEVSEPELREIGLKNCRLSFFERLLALYGKENHEYCHQLTRQGRMHPGIATFPNEAFYGNRLRPIPLPHQKAATLKHGSGNNPIEDLLLTRRTAFINCMPPDNQEEPDKMNSSEAEIIAEVVVAYYRLLKKELADNESEGDETHIQPQRFNANKHIGVIVPYRNQISSVRNSISRHASAEKITGLNEITIDTVERYQGSQRDLIVYGFTVKKPYQLDFLTDNEYYDANDNTVVDRKLNVAMTRARKRLVLVGNTQLLRRDFTFSRLIDYARNENCMYEAYEISSATQL